MGEFHGSAMNTLGQVNTQTAFNTMSSMRTQVTGHIQNNVGGHAPTIEMLHHAVCSMKPSHVEHMLHAGVNVNEPIDKEGHTVLDAFAVEHQAILKQLIELKASPEEKTNIFYANQE